VNHRSMPPFEMNVVDGKQRIENSGGWKEIDGES
jgi:hypothetical protein